MCAERAAVAKAVSEGHLKFRAIAISSNIEQDFIGPCGFCRQFLAEFGLDLLLYLTKPDGSYEVSTLRELLPRTFTSEHLNSGSGGK